MFCEKGLTKVVARGVMGAAFRRYITKIFKQVIYVRNYLYRVNTVDLHSAILYYSFAGIMHNFSIML